MSKQAQRTRKAALQLQAGQRVRTNAAYAHTISSVPRTGTLLRPLSWIDGLWSVRVDGWGEQMIHENWLEAEDV